MDRISLISEFKKKLTEIGFSYLSYPDNSYLLWWRNYEGRAIKVKLIYSNLADEKLYGSRNGNSVQSIGVFKFRLSPSQNGIEQYILAFENRKLHRTDFVIISSDELRIRLTQKAGNSYSYNRIYVVFWLLEDAFLYNCTSPSVEWEWYFLSLGLNGRMVDGSEWDYSMCLNDWNRLKKD
jgi:hypothetical protein